jgi:hypothetical protein
MAPTKNARAKADAAGARLRAVIEGDPSCTVTKRLLLLEADSRCRPKAMRARRPMCQLTPILVRRFAGTKKRRRARNCATPLQCLATRRGCNRIWIRVSAMLPPAMSPGDLVRRRHLSVELEGMKFQEIAPFLRAADSSQDRRRMSASSTRELHRSCVWVMTRRCRVFSASTRCWPTTHGLTA